MTLFSGLDIDVHLPGDEAGLQWEDCLFELQNAVEWRMVMLRGQDERSQMHAMSLLVNTCDGMTNGALIDDGARWTLQGTYLKIMVACFPLYARTGTPRCLCCLCD